MNRLTIAQTVNTLAGTQGTVDSTTSPVGYQSVLINMVDRAYNDIQIMRKDWKFMRGTVNILVNETDSSYSNPSEIAEVERVIYDKDPLRFIHYDTAILRDYTPGKPTYYTVNPLDNTITINDLDTSYTCTVQYYRTPDVMTANTSIPIIPAQYHSVIVYKTLIDLGAYLGNYDLITNYGNKYSIEIGHLMRSQLPKKVLKPRPLVI